MHVAVVGFGVEGRSAVRYWETLGAQVTVRDGKDGPGYLQGLDGFDLVVRSPGVHPRLLTAAPAVTTPTRQFFERCPARVVGVTGTKGKGTTAALVAAILQAAGQPVLLGGNIGVPALDLLGEVTAEHLVVLELSSFQLIDLDHSPDVAACLAVTSDHLNWHSDLDEYRRAKGSIFRHQTPWDRAAFHAADPWASRLADASPARRVPFCHRQGPHVDDHGWIRTGAGRLMPADSLGLIGGHNLTNACAAVAATFELVGRDHELIREVLHDFTGLPHRLQPVCEVAGVLYVDDSCATNPEATVAALRAFTQPKVVILGGVNKDADYDDLAMEVTRAGVRRTILVGEEARRLQAALERVGFQAYEPGASTMFEAVRQAARASLPGDVVLLSPGCASYDMFTSYHERGAQFQAAVTNL
ncbi:MAG: UDP-N-acetylmuramoyl-L-alanine--D-glutamate ligase [Actinomycetota bacterium]|nr:UDP-N-acetylmuramoyl-L-alanine--D-glutamate ligase [Actinomycetota bacterium]